MSVTMPETAAMTKYTLDCPDELWEAWKETVPRRLNLNDGLLKVLAKATLEERGDEIDEKTRDQIEEILER